VAAAKAILAGWLHARRASRSRCEACYLRGLNRASGRDIVHQRPPKRLRGVVCRLSPAPLPRALARSGPRGLYPED
jgi:hypothetical protein